MNHRPIALPVRWRANALCPPLALAAAPLVISAGTVDASVDMPHLFVVPPLFEKIIQDGKKIVDTQGKGADGSFLTMDDVKAIRQAQSRYVKGRKAVAAANEAELERCDVPRVDSTKLSFSDFLRRFRHRPAIIHNTGTAGAAGSLPFKLTPELVEEQLPQGILHPCLCRPQHGSNFHDATSDDDAVKVTAVAEKRYCLWQLPVFFKLLLSNRTRSKAAAARLVSNSELARKLPFQCRVGRSGNPQNGPLIELVVQNLGKATVSPSGSRQSSWWGPLELQRPHFDSATLWLSTGGTRTPVHMDHHAQFLVQLQGTKHVTLLPGLAASRGAARFKDLALARGGMLDMRTIEEELAEAGEVLDDVLPSGAMRCKLQAGEVLWMPPELHHDVYAMEASISLNVRFNTLAPMLDSKAEL